MMYGFGDDTPAPDTIAMMEELVIDHITDIASLSLPSLASRSEKLT